MDNLQTDEAEKIREALEKRPQYQTAPRLTKEQRIALARDFLKNPGVSFAELGRRYGISAQSVRYTLRRAAQQAKG